MTRKRDIFWGVYAAIMPYIILYGINHIIWLLDKYRARTYDAMPALIGDMMLNFCVGVALAVLAVHYLSRPVEPSKIPMVGLFIGLIHCAVIALYWPLLVIGVDMDFMWVILPKHGGETRVYMLLGFYIVLLAVYRKTRTFISKEELQRDSF